MGRIEKTTPSKPVLIEKSKKDLENENKTFDGYNDNDVTKKTATLGGATYRDYLVNKKNSRLPFHQQHQYAKKLGCFTYKEIIIQLRTMEKEGIQSKILKKYRLLNDSILVTRKNKNLPFHEPGNMRIMCNDKNCIRGHHR